MANKMSSMCKILSVFGIGNADNLAPGSGMALHKQAANGLGG